MLLCHNFIPLLSSFSQATASATESSNSAGVSASGAGPSQCDKGEAGPSGLGKENLLGAQSTAAMAGEASKPETLYSQPEIRRRRLERLLSATNQNSDQDKND